MTKYLLPATWKIKEIRDDIKEVYDQIKIDWFSFVLGGIAATWIILEIIWN